MLYLAISRYDLQEGLISGAPFASWLKHQTIFVDDYPHVFLQVVSPQWCPKNLTDPNGL